MKEAQRQGSKSQLHLVYGPMLIELINKDRKQYYINHIVPQEGKKVGAQSEIATKPLSEVRKKLTTTTIIIMNGRIGESVEAIIPEGTRIWTNTEGVPSFDPLRAIAAKHSHNNYLNRRDTLRNKMDFYQKPSRWSRYKMYFATLLANTRVKCFSSNKRA